MVPRSARPRFSEPHSSIQNLDGRKRGRTHQFYEAVAFEEVFMADVSLRLLAHLRAIPYLTSLLEP